MQQLTYRGRAPLRLGLAGGGTDVSPYKDDYGGAVMNVTIDRYAMATILPSTDGNVRFVSNDLELEEKLPLEPSYDTSEGLRLHRGVYNRIIGHYAQGEPRAMTLVTSVDVPRGSGLGASSALVVAMIEAFRVMYDLPFGEYDTAQLAFDIEREDIGMAGGAQDQYAAAFGGMNFIEFAANNRVIVNPLKVPFSIFNELESSVMLYFTGESRESSDIIEQQSKELTKKNSKSVEAMHRLKSDALEMKAAFIRGEMRGMADVLRRSWEAKKATADQVTNSAIDHALEVALNNGALAGKISGAGGGGFMMLLVDPVHWNGVSQALSDLGGVVSRCGFVTNGSTGWRVDQEGNVKGRN